MNSYYEALTGSECMVSKGSKKIGILCLDSSVWEKSLWKSYEKRYKLGE